MNMMTGGIPVLALLVLLAGLGRVPAADKEASPEEIIRAFSAKETEFYEAWKEYTYHQTADVAVLSVNGMPRHEKMTIISDIVFTDDGRRDINIVRRAGDLRSVIFTRDDEEVIDNLQPFALTEKELPSYDLTYAGKEHVDELSCYVFSVKPKSMKPGKFYFEGKIWVDDRDLQIVRTVGKPVPQKKNSQFPQFETIRQMIDNRYWFPVWTHADSELHFQRDTVRIEETISYDKYKRFASKATIQFENPKS
jgi:negative regulator of sigma E activity